MIESKVYCNEEHEDIDNTVTEDQTDDQEVRVSLKIESVATQFNRIFGADKEED